MSYSEHYLPWIIAGRGWGVDNPLEGLQDPKLIHTRTGRINFDSIIRPTLLNHITVAVDRYQNTGYTKTGGWDQKIGLTGLPYDNGAVPYVLFSGGTAAPLTLSNADYYFQGYTRYSLVENLTWTRGRHSMKFGVNYLHEGNGVADGRTGQGQFTFSNAQTSQPNAGGNFSSWGSATASFLLGEVSTAQTQRPWPAGSPGALLRLPPHSKRRSGGAPVLVLPQTPLWPSGQQPVSPQTRSCTPPQ